MIMFRCSTAFAFLEKEWNDPEDHSIQINL